MVSSTMDFTFKFAWIEDGITDENILRNNVTMDPGCRSKNT